MGRLKVLKKINQIIFLSFLVLLGVGPHFVSAQTSCGTNYCADQPNMSSGGSIDFSSPNYTGRATIGDTALPVGNEAVTSGSGQQAVGGGTTSSTPELEVTLEATNIDMGVFNPETPSTGTATFSVRSYLASGYVVYTVGSPPTAPGGAQIDPMTNGGTSTPGTEQFGINLVDNSNPNVGANPTQSPDNTFSFGYAATNYANANNFRYNSGDIIARSDSSSGVTTYTVSYLINVHPVTTPAGKYIFTQSIVVTSTF